MSDTLIVSQIIFYFRLQPIVTMPPKRRLSETSDGSEQAGVEEDITTGVERVEEEAEKVRVGPGRPKKKKVDPSQQLQVLKD